MTRTTNDIIQIQQVVIWKVDSYVFDDSFSALKKEMKEATVIIVVQRVSTVINTDQIIVLDHGKVAEIGTHSELLEKNRV